MAGDEVTVRLSVPCERLGLSPPPVEGHVRFLAGSPGWIVYLWTPGGDGEALAGWLAGHADVEPLPFRSSKRATALRAGDLPEPLGRLCESSNILLLRVRPGRDAELRVHGARETVRATLGSIEQGSSVDAVVDREPETPDDDPLTRAEREAVLDAYQAGYFDVPRGIKLSELADKRNTSASALSTLLRRAQRRLVERYIQGEADDAMLHSMEDEALEGS